jgi:hypothetical protein
MMQTQINPALQALMQTAQMVTPERGPTVAAKVAQAAQQKMQPQAAPPGIEALLPGAGVQAAQSAQAAQPATQGDLNRLRQMMAQAPQGQGIAAGADVQMAEGGIVGYAGPDGSDVKLDETNLPVNERFKRELRRLYESTGLAEKRAAYLQRTGATPEMAAKTMAPETAPQAMRTEDAFATPRIDQPVISRTPAPAPVDRKKRAPAPAPAPAPSAPIETMMDTRNIPMPPSESSAASAEAERIARESAEEQRKPRVKTQEEIAADAEQRRLTQSGIAGIAEQRRRFEDAEAARKAGLSNQARENLISFMTRVGGAGSLFRGMGQASRGMEPIIAAQRAAEQAANDKRIQYFDLLDQRKDAVERLNLAWLQKDAEKAMAESARIRGIDADLAKTLTTFKADEAKQRLIGEQAMARTQADIESKERENALGRASNEKIARIQAAARENPGGKEAAAVTRVQAAINGSPMLKALAEKAKFDPAAAAQYAAEEARLYQQLAPELLQNRPAPAPSAALKYNPATGKIE